MTHPKWCIVQHNMQNGSILMQAKESGNLIEDFVENNGI